MNKIIALIIIMSFSLVSFAENKKCYDGNKEVPCVKDSKKGKHAKKAKQKRKKHMKKMAQKKKIRAHKKAQRKKLNAQKKMAKKKAHKSIKEEETKTDDH